MHKTWYIGNEYHMLTENSFFFLDTYTYFLSSWKYVIFEGGTLSFGIYTLFYATLKPWKLH